MSVRGKSIDDLWGRGSSGAMRQESLAHLRSGGATAAHSPVTLTKYPDGKIRGTDGRHRITIARERGQTSIQGVLRTMGPRGGVKTKRVKIEI